MVVRSFIHFLEQSKNSIENVLDQQFENELENGKNCTEFFDYKEFQFRPVATCACGFLTKTLFSKFSSGTLYEPRLSTTDWFFVFALTVIFVATFKIKIS